MQRPSRHAPPTPATSLPPQLAGLEPLLDAVAAVVRDELRAFREGGGAPTFVDKHSSGLGPSVFLAAARAGEFHTFRVGKRFVAREADVRAYIERQLVTPSKRREPKVDELDVQLAGRMRPRGPNRVARTTTTSER